MTKTTLIKLGEEEHIILNLISDIGTFVAMLVAVAEFAVSIRRNRQDKHHAKCKDTLDAYSKLQVEVFDPLTMNFTRAQIVEIAEHYKKNADEYHLLGTYTARIEHFCVGVEKEIYDWETVYELSHGFFDGKIRNWIEPLMDKKSSFADFDPFENTRKVYDKMDKENEKRKNKRKKI